MRCVQRGRRKHISLDSFPALCPRRSTISEGLFSLWTGDFCVQLLCLARMLVTTHNFRNKALNKFTFRCCLFVPLMPLFTTRIFSLSLSGTHVDFGGEGKKTTVGEKGWMLSQEESVSEFVPQKYPFLPFSPPLIVVTL